MRSAAHNQPESAPARVERVSIAGDMLHVHTLDGDNSHDVAYITKDLAAAHYSRAVIMGGGSLFFDVPGDGNCVYYAVVLAFYATTAELLDQAHLRALLILVCSLVAFDLIEPVPGQESVYRVLREAVIGIAQGAQLPYQNFNFETAYRVNLFARVALQNLVGQDFVMAEPHITHLLRVLLYIMEGAPAGRPGIKILEDNENHLLSTTVYLEDLNPPGDGAHAYGLSTMLGYPLDERSSPSLFGLSRATQHYMVR